MFYHIKAFCYLFYCIHFYLISIIKDEIEAGYRLIDTAQTYGNEEVVGKAIKKCGVPREDLSLQKYEFPMLDMKRQRNLSKNL